MSSSVQVLLTVLAVSGSLYTNSIAADANNLLAEWGAWCLVTLIFQSRRLLGGSRRAKSLEFGWLNDVFAIIITSTFLLQRQPGVDMVSPLIAPLVLVGTISLTRGYDIIEKSDQLSSAVRTKVGNIASGILFLLLVSVAGFTLWHHLGGVVQIVTAYVYMLAVAASYITLAHQARHLKESKGHDQLLGDVVLKVTALLTIAVLASPGEIFDKSTFWTLVVTRGAFWSTILYTIVHGEAVVAASIYSFGVQLLHVHLLAGSTSSIVLCGTSVFTLWESVSGIRQFAASRTVILALSTLPVLLLVFGSHLTIDPCQGLAIHWEPYLPPASLSQHPIAKLADEAALKASKLKTSQSTTLDKAVARYQQDFGWDPPPGFDEWFRHAKNENVMVDGYKTITDSIHPFLGLSPAHAKRLIASAVEKEPKMILMSIRNRSVTFDKQHSHLIPNGLVKWLDPLPEFIPDMDFAVNLLDQPVVVVPNDELAAMKRVSDAPKLRLPFLEPRKNEKVEFLDVKRQNIWDLSTQACSPTSQSRSTASASLNVTFVQDSTSAMNTCENPSFQLQHGFFISPEVARLTSRPVPVFSQTKPSSYQDMLFPSPWYQKVYDRGEYNEGRDSSWDKKKDQLHWSGRTTSGYSLKDNWQEQHRQRFVRLGMCDKTSWPLLTKKGANNWKWEVAPLGKLSTLFNVKLTDTIQCEPAACLEQRRRFQMTRPEPMSATYDSKLVADIDGNSFSGRYYRLLESHSAVLKQTIFQEWHDDRLVPWAHYIPVSMEMSELPTTIHYLLETEEGKKLSEKIAKDSRAWARTVLRSVDLRFAFYRALLEYARVVSDDRAA